MNDYQKNWLGLILLIVLLLSGSVILGIVLSKILYK